MNDILEEFIEELERAEAASDMHYSVYYIPPYYQENNNDTTI